MNRGKSLKIVKKGKKMKDEMKVMEKKSLGWVVVKDDEGEIEGIVKEGEI